MGAHCAPLRKKKSSAVPHISERSHIGNLRQAIHGKGVILKRVETAGVYPLVRPRGVSADSSRFASAPLPMSTIIKIDKYPQKGYTNLTRGYGGIGAPRSAGAEKEPPRQDEHACGGSCPPQNRCKEKTQRKPSAFRIKAI